VPLASGDLRSPGEAEKKERRRRGLSVCTGEEDPRVRTNGASVGERNWRPAITKKEKASGTNRVRLKYRKRDVPGGATRSAGGRENTFWESDIRHGWS